MFSNSKFCRHPRPSDQPYSPDTSNVSCITYSLSSYPSESETYVSTYFDFFRLKKSARSKKSLGESIYAIRLYVENRSYPNDYTTGSPFDRLYFLLRNTYLSRQTKSSTLGLSVFFRISDPLFGTC